MDTAMATNEFFQAAADLRSDVALRVSPEILRMDAKRLLASNEQLLDTPLDGNLDEERCAEMESAEVLLAAHGINLRELAN